MGRGRNGDKRVALAPPLALIAADRTFSDLGDGEVRVFPHPYAGLSRDQIRPRAEELVGSYPLTPERLLDICHEDLALLTSFFRSGRRVGRHPARAYPLQAIALMYHSSLVNTLGAEPGFRKGENPLTEKDLLCDAGRENDLELKTTLETSRGTTNRSSVTENAEDGEGLKGRDSWYLFVSWSPPSRERDGFVRRVLLGFLSPEDWTAPTTTRAGTPAKGQIARIPFAHPKLVELERAGQHEARLVVPVPAGVAAGAAIA